MGALLTAFQTRIPLQRRVELTNQDSESGTTENTAVSGAAETDTIAVFIHRTGIPFDATNSEHVAIGVKGLVYFLYEYRGLPKAAATEAAKKVWEDACDAFCRTRGAMAAILPQTDSVLTPSTDPSGLTRPYFDRTVLTDMVPRMPSTASQDPINSYPNS